jgi:hypothetical protein
VFGNLLKHFKTITTVTFFLLLFISLFSRTAADVDLWGYLAFGKVFWESGYFPYQDIFSYTPTKSLWVYHEWLTGIIFYPLLKYSGAAGLQLFRYVIAVLTIYFVYAAAVKKGGSPLLTLAVLSPAMVLFSFGYSIVVRAQIFTYLFFILTLFILESARRNQKWFVLLWLIPIQLFWCNLHGGFLAGLGLISLYALGDALSAKKFMPFVIIFIPATLITLLNPYGVEYWTFILDATTMPRPEIDEWMSVAKALRTNYQVVPIIFFIVLSALCFLLYMFRLRNYFTEILIIAAISYLGYKHVRHTIFLGLLAAVYMPVILSEIRKDYFSKLPLPLSSWGFALLLAALLLYSHWFISPSWPVKFIPSFNITASTAYYPIGALNWMKKNNISGNVLPFFGWGEFLIWECHPKCKIGMDGRYETVYQEEVYIEYFDFLMGRKNWQEFLNKYPHDLVLIKPGVRIHTLMLEHTSWKNVYSDTTASLFLRK